MNFYKANGDLIDNSPNPFYRMKIGLLGDSITYGENGTQAYVASPNCFAELLKNEFAAVDKHGFSGAITATIVSHADDLASNCDVLIFMGGTNDAAMSTTIGTATDATTSTFYGALNVLAQAWLTKYPSKRIVFMTPPQYQNSDAKNMQSYVDAIKNRANYYSIPCLDLFSISGMDLAHNNTSKAAWTNDGVHPNDAGHKRIHDCIIGFLITVI